MEKDALLALFDREQRIDVEYYGSRRENAPPVIRSAPLPGVPGEGFIAYSDLRGADIEAVAREQVAFFESQGVGFEWKVYSHDYPADLWERLVALGFEAEDVEAVMVLDLTEAPEQLWQPVSADVRQILDAAQLGDVTSVHDQVRGPHPAWLAEALSDELRNTPDDICIYVAYAKGQPACSAWIRFHPGTQFASLWGGSTIPQFRHMGLYRAILAIRAQEARRRGFRFLTVDASPMSRPILERHGFQVLTFARACMWPAPESPNTGT